MGERGGLFGRLVFAAMLAGLSLASSLPSRAAESTTVHYTVTISPVKDSTLGRALHGSSTLIELQSRPPDDVTMLRHRALEDLDRLQRALRSSGYYDGKVTIKVDGQVVGPSAQAPIANYSDDSGKKKVPVTVSVEPGPLYKIRKITITGEAGLKPELTLTLKSGAPARAADIINERRNILDQVMRQGHPFATVTLQPATVDHQAHTLDVTYAVVAGPVATFGAVTVKGLDYVDRGFIQKRVAFAPGTRFTPAALDAMRDDLHSLDVFSSVKITPATKLDADGRLPVEVDVKERARHFIGAGANYSTNDGAGASIYWGDRNLFGGGERLKLEADLSGIGQQGGGLWGGADYSISGNFTSPDFLQRHQDLVSSVVVADEHDPDTFDKSGVTTDIGLQRKIGKWWKVSYGWENEAARIKDQERTANFFLNGPTGSVAFDNTDDLLNPTHGIRLSVGAEAFPTWFASNEDVFTTNSSASGYLNVIGKGDLVLAGRLAVDNAFGSSLHDLPADRRLYAGGGGSVRGYKFRSISPKDAAGNLIGGRSSITGSIELRYRFLDNFGIVPFFDAGTVSSKAMPNFGSPILYAAGIGLRYYTSIGPIRADIAMPLNPRHGDKPYAFYVSIGQAF